MTTKDVKSVTAEFDGVQIALSYKSTSGMAKRYSAVYQIPSTKADHDPYVLIVTAEATDGTTDLNSLR